jgi:hypothetical protein
LKKVKIKIGCGLVYMSRRSMAHTRQKINSP